MISRVAELSLQFEGYLNLYVFGPLIYFNPELGVRPFLPSEVIVSDIALHQVRLFAALVFSLVGYQLISALNSRGELLEVTLKSLLLCDVFYLNAFHDMVTMDAAYINMAAWANLIVGVYLAACRVWVLVMLNSKSDYAHDVKVKE